MRGLKVYVIFMLVLVSAAGKEGVEAADTCTSNPYLEGCQDLLCLQLCMFAYGKEAKGYCGGTTCHCTYPC
ncbi:hypothetical protein V6N13_014497 [Hibiscus sabdariffa]|uniref:Defensin-like protein n=1 Tax=Hibiscus sabdariffa TaxID=183260 RepID=A0ABR2RVV5_9ROSI